MSRATKRKHVAREVLEDYVEPEGKQEIVKVLGGQGNNLHKVVTASRQSYLVSMPTKFRRNVWIKRGDFIIVEPIEEGHRVRAEIVHILYPRQIKELCKEKLWPEAFEVPFAQCKPQNSEASAVEKGKMVDVQDSDESSDDDSDLFVNTNRPPVYVEDEDEEGSDEDEDADN